MWLCDYCGEKLNQSDWYRISFRCSYKTHQKHFMGHMLCLLEIKDRLHDPQDYTCISLKREKGVWDREVNRY